MITFLEFTAGKIQKIEKSNSPNFTNRFYPQMKARTYVFRSCVVRLAAPLRVEKWYKIALSTDFYATLG
jgi:hypothetical protein